MVSIGGPRPAGSRTTGPQPTAFDLGRYATRSLREFREEIEAEFIRMKLRALGIHRGEDDKPD